MVRIENNSLIIEIPCNEHYPPLQALTEIQSGLTDMLSMVPWASKNISDGDLMWGVKHTTELLKNMMLSGDQMSDLNISLSKDQIKRLNAK